MFSFKDLKDEDKIILSKSLAFSISSPIDTYRQNTLVQKPVTLRKTCIGVSSGLFVSSLISIPCHKTIAFLEERNINDILAVVLGVIMANIVKIPVIYNYKKLQTGVKLTKNFPLNDLKNVIKLSLIEDVIEESVKYTISKNKINKPSESTWKMTLLESALLFSLSYPFDILKNRGLYGIAKLNGSKRDFASKVMHKNMQNVLFFHLLSK